jgi:hypothetical protein
VTRASRGGAVVASFRAESSRRISSEVSAWDVYLQTIEEVSSPRHDPPLKVSSAWAKGGSEGPTVSATDPGAARRELEGLAHDCTYSFTSLEADDRVRATVYVWLESGVVSVYFRGSQEARIEGLRAVTQRFLNQFPESDFRPRIEIDGVVLSGMESTQLPSNRRKLSRALAEHAKAIWFGVAGTVVGGVLLTLVLRTLGLGG